MALSSLIAYALGVFSKKNSTLLILFATGDFIYAMSYIILKDYLTASTFILGIVICLVIGIRECKNKGETPKYLYVIFEILEIISFCITYTGPAEFLVLVANITFVFFSCYNRYLPLKYATLFFGVLLLIYNIFHINNTIF